MGKNNIHTLHYIWVFFCCSWWQHKALLFASQDGRGITLRFSQLASAWHRQSTDQQIQKAIGEAVNTIRLHDRVVKNEISQRQQLMRNAVMIPTYHMQPEFLAASRPCRRKWRRYDGWDLWLYSPAALVLTSYSTTTLGLRRDITDPIGLRCSSTQQTDW